MNERIKYLRKQLGLTQEEFGAKVKLRPSTITNYEIGIRTPSPALISAICQAYGVSEHWLRTGEGEMFLPQTRNEELAVFFGTILKDTDESYKKRLLYALSKLDESQWQVLIDLEKLMAGEE